MVDYFSAAAAAQQDVLLTPASLWTTGPKGAKIKKLSLSFAFKEHQVLLFVFNDTFILQSTTPHTELIGFMT